MNSENIEQRRKPSELTNAELECLCMEVEAIIDSLSAIDPATLTEEQKPKQQQKLQEALDVAEVLELEQMVRLVRNVQARVGYRVALSQQKRTDLRQRRRRGND